MLDALRTWGNAYAALPGGAPTVLVHDDCGHEARPVRVCSHCGGRIRSGHVHVEPGPGADDPAFVRAGRPAR